MAVPALEQPVFWVRQNEKINGFNLFAHFL